MHATPTVPFETMTRTRVLAIPKKNRIGDRHDQILLDGHVRGRRNAEGHAAMGGAARAHCGVVEVRPVVLLVREAAPQPADPGRMTRQPRKTLGDLFRCNGFRRASGHEKNQRVHAQRDPAWHF